ncbi:hypothetical protein DYH09_13140 [bacterium CPR1]|nr:hypothetical protein [bacterium CPR1]
MALASTTRSAGRLWNGLVDAILTLEESPERCPVARESVYFQPKIRQLLYEDHRILFTVSRKTVFVLHIRYAGREDFDPRSLGAPGP